MRTRRPATPRAPRSAIPAPAQPATTEPPAAPDAGPPPVRLGARLEGGLAPAIFAIVERGVTRRPAQARELHIELELATHEDYPPVRIVFAEHYVIVEDGAATRPDVRIRGALPDLISLIASPSVRGVPLPINAHGRAALGLVASGRVRVQGSLQLVRRVLTVIRL